MVKGPFDIDSSEHFQVKPRIYNHIPALHSFPENPTDRICPVTESAPLSPIQLNPAWPTIASNKLKEAL